MVKNCEITGECVICGNAFKVKAGSKVRMFCINGCRTISHRAVSGLLRPTLKRSVDIRDSLVIYLNKYKHNNCLDVSIGLASKGYWGKNTRLGNLHGAKILWMHECYWKLVDLMGSEAKVDRLLMQYEEVYADIFKAGKVNRRI